ncbi:Apyrase [Ancylostoma ceylanicum]|uniref:Apyrase n=1 Tax=Ancylostoma ceylanicum TaxID=53326 RepID=A0A0D6LC20_9BILA|nr:Apyrase [Ancylostoma ceylanicum]
MDNDAKVEKEQWKWRAVTRKSTLTLHANKKDVTIDWIKDSDQNLTSGLNYKGRAMEMSDLSEYNGHLLSPDDKTGMLYEIKGKLAIPWVFLNSGPGNTTKGMKVEWLTTYGNLLYAGGHGSVRSVNWKDVFSRMRTKAGYPAPGYLTHEAVQYSEKQGMWYFLPRKASKTPYEETADETKGTNLLIKAPSDLTSFEVVYIGGSEKVDHPDRGYSAFDFVPDSADTLIVAIKSKEVTGSPPESYITVFDTDGQVLLPDQKLEDGYKFEGIYFV